MASDQIPLPSNVNLATDAHADSSTASPSIKIPDSFKIHEIDKRYDLSVTHPLRKAVVSTEAPLGVLSNFTGTFKGNGFNLIFRPNSGGSGGTKFPIPVSPPPPNVPNENVLELNLTQETLAFSPNLGSVPNRGLGNQGDIFLNGVPYLQTISDFANPKTGKANAKEGIPIHLEPGLWMHIPATTVDPVVGESLCRMASIPHGTTINAQCLEPASASNGRPNIPAVDPTPFPIGNPTRKIPFPSQTLLTPNTARIPQDLTKFNDAGTITQDILNNPNKILSDVIAKQNITKFIFFKVSTIPVTGEIGGGVANIAFLDGDVKATGNSGIFAGPNANVPSMEASFWIETVQVELSLPAWRPGQPPISIPAKDGHPAFYITPPHAIDARNVNATYTQIQYSQNVLLNFATLSWPHISVATLVPEQPFEPQIQF